MMLHFKTVAEVLTLLLCFYVIVWGFYLLS